MRKDAKEEISDLTKTEQLDVNAMKEDETVNERLKQRVKKGIYHLPQSLKRLVRAFSRCGNSLFGQLPPLVPLARIRKEFGI